MEIFKIIGVAFVATIASILLKNTKPELSFAIVVTGVIIISLFIVDKLENTFAVFATLAQSVQVENGLFKALLKIVGVGYITEFGAGILNDFGSNTLADKVVLGGKITMVMLSLPIFESLVLLMREVLQLT